MYNYTLDELQEWYGRKNGDVSISAKSLVLKKLNLKNRAIAEEAINFVATSYAQQATPLSIRQVHYHLVHQLTGTYTNTIKDYNTLTKLILRARIAGKDYKYKEGDIVILKGIIPKTSEGIGGEEGVIREIRTTDITPGTTYLYKIEILSGIHKGRTPYIPEDNISHLKVAKDFTKDFIPWHMISETESLVSHKRPTGMNPEDAIKKALEEAAKQPGKDPWDAMNKCVVVFTEKRELQPQLEFVTDKYFVRLISLRGYGAWSRLYKESLEYKNFIKDRNSYELYAYFITDHDPSGLDINRLYASILKNFWKVKCEDHRVMLKKDQVDSENLPPAPTKVKDPRAKWYIRKFSTDCWEVDALGREKMQKTLEDEIKKIIDFKVWDEVMKENAENAEKTKKRAEDMMKGEKK